MELHPTLKRQLKKAGADEQHPPSLEAWQALLARINTAYQGADQERYILERSLNISSKEMQKLYENLKLSSASALHQEKEKLVSILRSLTDGVLETDIHGNIRYLNPTAEQILGIQSDTLTHQHLLDFFRIHALDKETIGTHQQLQDALKETSNLRDDNAQLIHPNKAPLAISFSLSPIRNDSQLSGYVATFRDMHLQKTAEQELRKAKQLAEEAAETKSNFLATMSHEIRTPLNGVIGMATLLNDTTLNETQQNYVNTLKRSTEVLLSLINDILDFSKMDAGKVQLASSPFALSALVHDLQSMFNHQFMQKNLHISYQLDDRLPPWLIGDEHRLRQVLINLIGNALKFTEQGGISVHITLINAISENHLIRFSVKDTGIGISHAAQARLFEAFTQADSSTTRQFGGTGLGLTISKKIVELMQGTLNVESEEGKGSHFFFDINLYQAQRPRTQHPESLKITPSTHNKTILLVEDNQINQLVAGEFLRKFGYRYDIAENGLQAIERLGEKQYDAILMDCQMPVLDGFTATQRIRALENETKAHIPIIGLTANALEGDREKCLACGMDDFTTKPIKAPELENKLKHWCFHHSD